MKQCITTHVAYIDILGFRQRLESDGIDTLYEILKGLIEDVETLYKTNIRRGGIENDPPQEFYNFAKIFHFSDTIILIPNYDGFKEKLTNHIKVIEKQIPKKKSENSITFPDDTTSENTVELEFYRFLEVLIIESILKGIPLRGATAFGDIIVDDEKGILLGQPIVDAYELEKKQDWIGVVFHPSTAHFKIGDSEPTPTLWYKRYDVPMKGNVVESQLVLECFTDDGKVNQNIVDKLKEMREGVTSPEIKKKYDNTLAFIETLERS